MSAFSDTNSSLLPARPSARPPDWKAYAPWWVAAFLAGGLVVVAGCGGEQEVGPSAQGDGQGALGLQVYRTACITCHQADGGGIAGVYPPLHADWVEGDAGRLVRLLLDGMEGEMEIGGQVYDQRMVSYDHLTDEKIAAVLTFVRQNFGHDASAVTVEEVARVRAADDREKVWTPGELWTATGIPADTAEAAATE